ncbi:MAG: hypothetical protein EPN19_02975 [Betaproteobacteria bacterium]|nr:MAG: hypothetical protein EPN19_02975 [Betaproteobacteria bacterium]
MLDLNRLIESVQRNCDIADARHARDATMCNYLLQMRELYCWEEDLPLAAQPGREALATWLSARESQWNALEGRDYDALAIGSRVFAPFDAAALNRELLPHQLLYGAGYGRFHRPHFFLAALERRDTREGVEILVAGCEYARDLVAVPAAFRDNTIVVRREALRRWLWDKVAFWRSRRGDGALARALATWELEADDAAGFERMVAAETETLILHELGEARAGGLLGARWEEMLAALSEQRAELLVRAVRDNLADCLSTLPGLLEREARASIHFYFSQFDGLRRELFPALTSAYQDWRETGAAGALRPAIERGSEHWARVARELLSRPVPPGGGEARALAL